MIKEPQLVIVRGWHVQVGGLSHTRLLLPTRCRYVTLLAETTLCTLMPLRMMAVFEVERNMVKQGLSLPRNVDLYRDDGCSTVCPRQLQRHAHGPESPLAFKGLICILLGISVPFMVDTQLPHAVALSLGSRGRPSHQW